MFDAFPIARRLAYNPIIMGHKSINTPFLSHALVVIFVVLCTLHSTAQELTGLALLEKAIQYHDPGNQWASFKGDLTVVMTTPKAAERTTNLQLDFPNDRFAATVKQGGNTIDYILQHGDCTMRLNQSNNISEAAKDSLNISCDRAKKLRDYYTYLYGLPMKLQDSGTIIDPVVQRKTLKGKSYLTLKVTYDNSVGKDTWYFYFNPTTYAMEVYQFFHDETKNDGEYILLSDIQTINQIKFPKTRAWYYNLDDVYLGTDTLIQP